MSLDQFVTLYIDYVNNFITVERFAEYYAIDVDSAQKILDCGRTISQIDVKTVIY